MKLSENHRSINEVDIDFDKIARIGQKVNELLVRKTKNSPEAYATLRFLCVYYEMSLEIEFMPEFEEELKKAIKKNIDCQKNTSQKQS
jgi:hypothetical protein